MTVTADHRDRLDAIRERTHTARSRRKRARELFDAAREAGDQDAQAVAQLQLDDASMELETAEALQSQMLSALAGLDRGPVGGGIFENPEVVEQLTRLGNGTFPIGALDLGPLSTREQLVAQIDSGSWGPSKLAAAGPVSAPDSARRGAWGGVAPQLRRPLSILDLIPVSPMTGKSFDYLQETGSYFAAETAELQMKPEGELGLTDATVTARTIANFLKAPRQALADVPGLQATINDRLVYACMRRLEGQVLAGDGAGENLRGILNWVGTQSVAFTGGQPLTDLTLTGIVGVLGVDAVPDAVALNPVDWGQMLLAKTSGSGSRLDSSGAFSAQPVTMWGLPAVPSTAVTQGQALVGAFGTACHLYIREPVNVRLTDSDQDDFLKNRVTALAELRAGLAVWAPSAFAKVALK
jgi:hypothetical protein